MARKPRATIIDVARLAGVAVSTVSAVLNGTVKVSPERTTRVREAMRLLDYRPDELGRSLKTGRSRVIGVVVPDITNPFYPEIFRDIELAARAKGYSVVLCDSADDPDQERRHLETLYGRRVDGALVACTDSRVSYDWLESRGFPVVFFERIPLSGKFTAVSTDHRHAAGLATDHFLRLGHRRIAFLLTRPTLSSNSARLAGFRESMEAAGAVVRPEYVSSDLQGVEGGYRTGLELLALKSPPTAILCSNSAVLLGLVRALGEQGVRIPGQVSLIGFDHTIWTENFTPALTTLAQPTAAIAREAMRLLTQELEGAATVKSVLHLKDELLLGASTAAPSKRFKRSDLRENHQS
jgi:LacI family transcriptional regulator